MATEDASLRQDLIENAVQHEVVPIGETVPTEQSLDASFAADPPALAAAKPALPLLGRLLGL